MQIVSKIFQGLFADADYHLDQAQTFHSVVVNSASRGSLYADQTALAKARAHSRACIISVVAGTESLCHCIEDLLRRRTIDELPSDWVPKKLRGRQFKDWPVFQKVQFIPVLCCSNIERPAHYFQESQSELLKFQEITKIRNSIIHGGMVKTQFEIEFGPANLHTVTDDFPGNFWDMTHFRKDVRSISYEQASFAYILTMNLLKEMIALLEGRITLPFLRDEELYYENQRYLAQRESINESVPKWCRTLLG